uniref:Uncharacterized immunity region protein 8 n=1 Tax=Bacillus phage phi105 TaxID=10717 RepID=YIM8_BPPH1|nr:RecName: Full=Uncharacterized immunity region protein 8 [Bacillus phage phi105]prf//1112178N ORF 8 [Bacillus phage phi105]
MEFIVVLLLLLRYFRLALKVRILHIFYKCFFEFFLTYSNCRFFV